MYMLTLALWLLLSTANGFGPSATSIHRKDMFSVLRKLEPTYAVPDTSDESSSKIRRMSWFLTTQLLEITLKEASKGEDKSEISMDDIQKLADVLQRTEEDMLQRNAESPELYETAAASKVQDTKCDVNESEDLSLSEEPVSALDAEKVAAIESILEATKVSDEEIASEESGVEYLEDKNTNPGIDAKEEKSAVDVIKESTTESETIEAAKTEAGTFDAEEKGNGNVSLRPGAARIPDVISREYGRSLEVISSAVPPLRDSSIQKGSAETISMKPSEKDERPGEVELVTAVETLPSINTMMSVENSSRLPSEENESEVELNAKCSTVAVEDRTVSENLGKFDIHQSLPHPSLPTEEQPMYFESVSRNTHGIAHSEVVDDKDEIASTKDSSKIESIAGKKTIYNGSRQPSKQNLSQAELAAKYAEMTLEDRAFEIIKDLGMIEIHESSTSKLSAVQEQRDNSQGMEEDARPTEETQNKIVPETNAESTDSQKKETISKRHRFFRPIRNVFESSKEKLLGTSTPSNMAPLASTPTLTETARRARQQPKSPSKEALLAEKYGQLSIEDRAYAILCDLGMI